MKGLDKRKLKRIYVALHQTVCYILWCANLAHLTSKYFAYETQVDLGFYTPVTLTQPNLSLCFDLNTLLGGHQLYVFNDHGPQYLGMTMQQIFEKVPGVHQVVKRCAFRDPVSDRIIQVENSTECHQLFTVKRYRMNSFLCYLFHLNQRHNFSFNSLALSLNEPKLLYNLAITGSLAKGHTVSPLLHLDELADVDRIFMKEIFPSKEKNEVYHLEYDLYEIERLPHPYTTRCGPDPRMRCRCNCFARKWAEIGVTHTNCVDKEAVETNLLKIVEFGEEQKQYRSKVNKICGKLCPSDACSRKLVITRHFGPFHHKKYKLNFNVGSYKSPINLIRYSPKVLLKDYVTQFFSVSGIWLGFSVVALIFRRKRLDVMRTCKILAALKAKLSIYSSLNLLPPTQTQGATDQGSRLYSPENRKLRQGKRVLSIAFRFVTFLIFSIQALNLCFVYVKYETILTYSYSLNPEFEYRLPSTAICVDINDLLSSRGQMSVTEENYEDILTKKNTWINLTLDQIFDQTIGEEILFKCRTKSYEFMEYFKGKFQLKSGEECLKEEFSFHKYYSRWQMCYLFTPKKLPDNLPRSFKQQHLIYGEVNPSKLYSLILSPKVKNYSKIHLIVYFDGANASYISSDFRATSPNLDAKRVVILNFHTIVFTYLPPPYDTKCNPTYPQHKCINDCQKTKLRQMDRLPYSSLLKERTKRRLLSFEDLKNDTFNDFYWKAENYCREKCDAFICSDNYSLTYAHHALERTDFDVEVVVSLETAPRTFYWAVPCFELYDFLYQTLCLLAFWLGFSFVGLNLVLRKSEKRFNEAARVLCSKSIKLLLRLKEFHGELHGSKGDDLKRSLLVRRVICYSLCVLGMCSHLLLPISEYLSYPTELLTTISYEEPVPYRLFVCSEAQDLFERKVLFGRSRQRSDKYLFDRNLDEIMEEAKQLNYSMSACGYWGLNRDKDMTNEMKKVTDRVFFETRNSSVCDEMVETDLFLLQGYLCFGYKLRRGTEWNLSQMFASINQAKTVLSVSLNSTIVSERFTVVAFRHIPKVLPLHTSAWAPTVHGKPDGFRFVVSYFAFSVEKLLFPYSDKGFVASQITYCIFECTNARMRQFNITRIAFGNKLPHNKLLSNSLRESSLVSKLTSQIDRQCEEKCLKDISLRYRRLHYMVTVISEPLPDERGHKDSTRFDLRRTDNPVLSLKFLVAIPIYGLIINIGSVISIWFGLSVISIPNLATEGDMEKLYIRTVDNLETTNCILKRISAERTALLR